MGSAKKEADVEYASPTQWEVYTEGFDTADLKQAKPRRGSTASRELQRSQDDPNRSASRS
jgi:hypothetical protein